MARLASREKLLFYPTPLSIVKTIASNIQAGDSGGTILDPCCGTGEPLAELGQTLGLTTYGNEIHPERYARAAPRLDHCLNGAREFLEIDGGGFNVVINNPPYDHSLSGSRMEIEHIKHDLALLARGGLGIWIIPAHIVNEALCYLLARCCQQVNLRRFPDPEYERFHQVVIFGLKRDDPGGYAYYSYQNQAEYLRDLAAAGPPVLEPGEFDYRFYAAGDDITGFRISFPEAGTILAEIETGGVQTTEAWQELFATTDTALEGFRPVLPLSAGHTAFVIAAGVIDGCEVRIPSEDEPGQEEVCILKGSTTKCVQTSRQVEEIQDGARETIRERERLVHRIILLNLRTGGLREYNNLDDRGAFTSFLIRHQEVLAETVSRTCRPLFRPERDIWPWLPQLGRVRAPGVLPGRKEAGRLLEAQEIRAAALATRLKGAGAAILAGEMGTGKSAISLANMALLRSVALSAMGATRGGENWKLVIVCPAQVVEKWQREAKAVLRDFGVAVRIIGEARPQSHAVAGRDRSLPGPYGVTFDGREFWQKRDGQGRIIARGGRRPVHITRMAVTPAGAGHKTVKVSKPALDVMRAMQAPGPGILVMSYQVAKNASRWVHAPAVQGRFIRCVVEEEETLPDWPYRRKISKEVVAYEKVLVCPDCGAMLLDIHGNPLRAPKKMGERKRKCGQCDAPLWQRIPFKYGGRVAAADFLNRRYAGQYDLILDESHKTKGGKTDAGYASQDLIAGARKVLSMTGTLYAGKVSSIFHLLYRLKPEFRRLYGPGEVQRFVNHHGLQEIVTTITTTGNAYNSAFGYTRESVRVREVPGVTPGIILMLLPMTAFIKLQDVGLHLPPYREERLPVRLDGRFDEGLKKIKEIYERAVQLAREGNSGLLSAWLYAGLGWPDHPVPDTLVARDSTTGDVINTFDIPGLADEPPGLPLPKDQALLELVEAELGKGRGVGVFFAQVKRRDWMGRIQKLLAGRGVYSEILRRGTCRPDRRERWYRAFVERCRERGQEPVLLTNGNLIKEGLDLVELPTLVETGIEFRLNDLRQRDRRSWRLIQDRPVRVVFLYYEDSWQETALRLVAAKLKAATLVQGDLVSGLAEMDTDGDNLIDALMEAITRGRRSGWNGMGLARLAESGEPGRLPANANGKLSGGRDFEAVFRREQEKAK